MSAILLDTETTGTRDPRLVEAAWQRVASARDPAPEGELFCQRYDPGRPIELGAMATHHITPEDLAGCPPASSFRLPSDVEYLIGHNVDFDWTVIGRPAVRRIDTLALCRALWPEADTHRQTAMLYLLDRPLARELCPRAHAAAVDLRIALELLRHIVAKLGRPGSWEELWRYSERARVPEVMPFGKHRGTRLADVPADYREWLLRKGDLDPYLEQALRALVGA